MKKFIVWFSVLIAAIQVTYGSTLSLIPYPQYVQETGGIVSIPGCITIGGSSTVTSTIDYIEKELQAMGLNVSTSATTSAFLKLRLDSSVKGVEAYELSIHKTGVEITASTEQGLFYGFQTLRQLIVDHKITLPCVVIKDQPAFPWRAFMLDEARHFKGKEVVKRLLDKISQLKMNIFHWHLTDDQGWRIEIKKYPLLIEIGSKRDSTQIGGNSRSTTYRIEPHSGFYTQEEIAEIIAYARKLHITIVPEIEMPGHASAAIAAYPWLGTGVAPAHVQAKFGVFENVYNVADSRVHEFLQDVISEVIDLFPSEVIHIGGDEVRYNQWLASSQVMEFMKGKQMQSPADLQVWFTNSISEFIQSKGRRMMGWNDITGDKVHDDVEYHPAQLTNQLASNTIIHFWRGDLELVRKAVEKGYSVVNSYHWFTYLDYTYKNLPLEKSYSFQPITEGIPVQYHKQILGLGAQMWSEWIPSEADLYRQVFPRLAAYAECGWTNPENKSWERFSEIAAQRWSNRD